MAKIKIVEEKKEGIYEKLIRENRAKLDEGHLEPDDVINNLQISLAELVRQNDQLEAELRVARSDIHDMKEAIVNSFIDRYFTGR